VTCHSCRVEAVKAGITYNAVNASSAANGSRSHTERPIRDRCSVAQRNCYPNLHCLVEGNSVRVTARLCDVTPRTVLSILKLAGENCYPPAEVADIICRPIMGVPDLDEICTSHVERSNLTIRDADPTSYPANERLQQEMGDAVGCALPLFRLVQLLSDSPGPTGNPGDGGRRDG